MATKNRNELKQKFLNGLTPDEDDFGDLIDGTINIADDDISAKNGKIGIGTNDPQANLHIYATTDKSEIGSKSGAFMIGNANAHNLSMDNNEILAQNGEDKSLLHVQRNGGDVRFNDGLNLENKVIIKDTGRVGIGTVEPGAPLHVGRYHDVEEGDKNAMLIIGNKDGYNLSFDDNEIMAKGSDGMSTAPIYMQANGGDFRVNHKDTDHQFIVKDTGKVGIGTSNPKAHLHINFAGDKVSEGGTDGALIIGKTSGAHLAVDENEIMAKADHNSVGTLFLNWTGNQSGKIKYYGSLEHVSDEILKKNIKPLTKGTKEIKKLKPVTYKWKNPGNNKALQFGFIAQEVREVLKDIVHEDSDGGPLSMDSMALIPILVKSIQEQQEQIDSLEARIAKLEKLISKK